MPFDWVAALSGAAAGGCSRMVVAPLDVLKIRFQLQAQPVGVAKHLHRPGTPESTAWFRSFHHAVVRLWQEEGFRAFWRGNVAATWLWVLYSGVQFPVYTAMVRRDTATQQTELLSALGAGATAASIATVATYPFDRLRTILASQGVPKQFNTTTEAAQSLWRSGGVRSLYQGLTPAVLQVAPYVGLNFALYELFVNMAPDSSQGFLFSGAEGWVAGSVAKFIVYPLDTVKRRLQFQGLSRHRRYGTLPVYTGTLHALTSIVRDEGVVGLYKGLLPTVLKSGASVGATFAFYNVFSNHLKEGEE